MSLAQSYGTAYGMTTWIDIGPVDQFPEGAQACVSAGGEPVVLFHANGQFHAVRNECPHAGLPLGNGERRDMVITCPYHGYAYHIKTGRNIDFPHEEPPVRVYPVRVQDQRVQVGLTEKDRPEPQRKTPKRDPAPQPDPAAPGPCRDEPEEDPAPDADQPTPGKPDCPDGYPARRQ